MSAQEATPRYYFSSYAGLASAGTRDGPAQAAQFNRPKGLTVDALGNVYVVDSSHTVRKIATNGVVSTVAGKPGDSSSVDGPVSTARFLLAGGIAVNPAGTLYVTSYSCLRQINANGTVTTLAGLLVDDPAERRLQDGTGTQARFDGLAGLTIDSSGVLYAGDTLNRAVRRITTAGVVTTVAAASFRYPHDLTIDGAGAIYVADGGTSVRKIEPDGRVTTWAGTPDVPGSQDGTGPAAAFEHLWGIAADLSGKIYAAEGAGTIRAITPSATVSTFAGDRNTRGYADGIGLAASFANPAALATDVAGNVYVADEFNNVIRKITPAAVVSTLAGMPPIRSRGAVDGSGVDARFNDPRAIAVTADGICYVADSANHVIRKIAQDGTVSTFAGGVGQPGAADGTGTTARFDYPDGVAVDQSGNVYVIDNTNAVRKITSAGVVSTLVASAPASTRSFTCIAIAPSGDLYVGEFKGGGQSYPAVVRRITAEGEVTIDARVASWPHSIYSGMAFGAEGTLYVCDRTYNTVVRVKATASERIASPLSDPTAIAIDTSGRIILGGNYGQVGRLAPDGSGEILGGIGFQMAQHDGVGTDALFHRVTGVTVDASGAIYVACADNTVRKGVVAGTPTISAQPQSLTVAPGVAAMFSVTAAAVPAPTYQWFFNGQPIAGATTSAYTINSARTADAGEYTVVVSNDLGSVTSSKGTLSLTNPANPGNPGTGGTGGGGAPSLWFMAAVSALVATRYCAGAIRPHIESRVSG